MQGPPFYRQAFIINSVLLIDISGPPLTLTLFLVILSVVIIALMRDDFKNFSVDMA